MIAAHSFLQEIGPTRLFKETFSHADYIPLDLSVTNKMLDAYNITDAKECQEYINKVLREQNGKIAYGGYLEKRNLYGSADRFKGEAIRNIHLGMDFWIAAGTPIYCPLAGTVHSFANNADFGNYGPTIILHHIYKEYSFYTLYGHLSLESLEGLSVGKAIPKGTVFATLGAPEVNVGYAPHLHFQVILDVEQFNGDYPGVCAVERLSFYQNNCPNPNLLLGL